MYTLFDNLHSWNRYLLLAALVFVLFRAFSGWFGKKHFSDLDNKGSLVLLISTHVQFLLGFVVYYLYTSANQVFANMGETMKDSTARYFTVEHITAMTLAVVLITIGRSASKKAHLDEKKHSKLAIFTALAALIIVGTLAQKGLLLGRNG